MKASKMVMFLLAGTFAIGMTAFADQCKVHLSDRGDKSNPLEVDIVAQKVSDSRYKEAYLVTENPGDKFQDIETAAFNGDETPMIATDAVSHPTKKELLQDYDRGIKDLLNKQMNSEGGGQIIFTVQPKNQCDSIEATLIEFFVNEFFFYG